MKKKILIVIGIMFVIWLIIGIIDLSRVNHFDKPIFCIVKNTADDGGTGHYIGLGYSIDIKGSFMPEDESKGITEYSYYIFGKRVFRKRLIPITICKE